MGTVPPEHPQIVSLTESMGGGFPKLPHPKLPIPTLPKFCDPSVPLEMEFKIPSKTLWFHFGEEVDVFFICKECGAEGKYILSAKVRALQVPTFTLETRKNLRFFAKVGVGANTNLTPELLPEVRQELVPPIVLKGLRIPFVATFAALLELNGALEVSGLNAGVEIEVVRYILIPIITCIYK